MLYYEIVRLDNNEPGSREDFKTVQKLVRRRWTYKAIEFLSKWDHGRKSFDRARALGKLRDTILDYRSTNDRIVATDGCYTLCESHCPNGHCEAYYLVYGVSALALVSL